MPLTLNPNDKKKTMVVGALIVAILGIGAFQFVGGGAPPPAPTKKEEKKDAKAKDGAEAKPPAKNPMYALALNARDPFQPAPFSAPTPTAALPLGSHPLAATPLRPAPGASAPMRAPSLPPAMEGNLPTMTIPSGSVPPNAMPAGLPAPTDAPTEKPLKKPEPPEPAFAMALVGVVEGARPLAVFRTAGGGERLVPVGGTLDGSTRLLSVGPRRARVRFHGRTLDLKLSDEPPARADATKTTPAPPAARPKTEDAPSETPPNETPR